MLQLQQGIAGGGRLQRRLAHIGRNAFISGINRVLHGRTIIKCEDTLKVR